MLDQAIAEHGAMPLPPYIAARRKPDDRDLSDYQTMFADAEGAVAAPTAGLHFTDALLARLRERGIDLTTVTLHVGAGTFLPVKTDDTAATRCTPNGERFPPMPRRRLNETRQRGGRIVAVGTTSLRLLESAAADGRHHRAVCRRDVDLHHARLSLSRRRRAADEFSSAALDPVHAGVGVLRARHHAARLCACDPRELPVLFLRRCVPAVSLVSALRRAALAFAPLAAVELQVFGRTASAQPAAGACVRASSGPATSGARLSTSSMQTATMSMAWSNSSTVMASAGLPKLTSTGS